MGATRIRWGVVSTANIGRAAVIPAIRASDNGELAAVASREEGRARSFATDHGIPRHFGSYEALLADPDIDAVYIPLPNALHRTWTIAAARAGKHVLCEKPLGLTAAECLEMDAAAREAGVLLMEAFMYRFHPRTERLVAMVREGVAGRVRAIRAAFTFRLTRPGNIRLDPDLGGGSLMDVGCYCVNVARTVLGSEPVAAQAMARWTARGVDDEMGGSLYFHDGVRLHFDCSLTMERREFVEVAGTDATLRVESAFLPGSGDVVIEELRGRGDVRRHAVGGVDEYRRMVEHFAAAVLGGGAVRYPTTEAAANMRAIEALYRSARSGSGVVVVERPDG